MHPQQKLQNNLIEELIAVVAHQVAHFEPLPSSDYLRIIKTIRENFTKIIGELYIE